MQNVRPSLLCVLAALAYLGYTWAAFGSPLAWVTLGETAADLTPYVYTDEGYDGQFTYFIARAPLEAAPRIDVAAYRYQRILLPVLGWSLSLGVEAVLPFVLVGVNLAALGLSVAVLEHLLAALGVSRWYALGYGLSLGVLGTVRLALPEVLAYGLCIGGLWYLRQERLLAAAVLFALAALGKETTLILAAGVGFHLLFIERQPRQTIRFSAVTLLPFFIWQGILWAWLGEPGIGSGGAGATSFEIIPFMGVIRIWTEGSPAAFLALVAIIGPAVLLPTLWGLWQCWQDARTRRWTLYSSLLLFNAAIMLFVPFSTYRELLGILRFIVGLQLAVVLYAAERARGPRRPLRYSTLWAMPTLILIMSDAALAAAP